MVLLDGMKLASCGVVLGGVTAAALAGTLTAFLFGVRSHDLVTFTVTPVVLGVVAFGGRLDSCAPSVATRPRRDLKSL
jgi:Mg/Co/Ni transporter MgtE